MQLIQTYIRCKVKLNCTIVTGSDANQTTMEKIKLQIDRLRS